jgi:hypothetical protein
MTHPSRISLSVAERKHRLPHGAQKQIAAEEQVSAQYVSAVLADLVKPRTERGTKTVRRIQVAIARKLRMRVDDVFPPENSDVTPEPTPSGAAA